MQHIWTMLMHKILQNHLLCAIVTDLKIYAIYALYPESFCDKNLANRKVFVFCDSGVVLACHVTFFTTMYNTDVEEGLSFRFIAGGKPLNEFRLQKSN